MRFDTGTIIVIVAILLFYLRLIALQWGKSKRLREASSAPAPRGKKAAGAPPRPSVEGSFIRFSNPYLVGLAVLVMLAGVFMNVNPGFGDTVRNLWWIPVVAGLGLFTFLIR